MASDPSNVNHTTSLLTQLFKTAVYQKRVERIARKYTQGNFIHWNDAAQIAHEKVVQATRAGKFRRGGMEEFHQWATIVAKFAIIDSLRQEQYQRHRSLDEPIPGSDLLILDTIADDFNLLAAVEWADLVRRTEETIIELSYQYPQRGYLKLWEGLKQGTTETQLASEWQCCQGTISKRKKELCQRVAERLGLL